MWPTVHRKKMRKSYKVLAGKSERKGPLSRFRRRGKSITVKIWSKFMSLKHINLMGLLKTDNDLRLSCWFVHRL
jgi:hypothetical protein